MKNGMNHFLIVFIVLQTIISCKLMGQDAVKHMIIGANDVVIEKIDIKTYEIIDGDSLQYLNENIVLIDGEPVLLKPEKKALFTLPKDSDLSSYLKSKLEYPEQASNLDVVSILYVIILKEGMIKDVGFVRLCSDYRYDLSALNAIQELRVAEPALQNGVAVNSIQIIPVRFF